MSDDWGCCSRYRFSTILVGNRRLDPLQSRKVGYGDGRQLPFFEFMEIDQARIDNLVERRSEALSVEIKNWIDPATTEGQAKIVKAVLALRNSDGGYLVIGFDDKTLLPEPVPATVDIRQQFHHDKIQGLISKYAFDSFEIAVGFSDLGTQTHPVIVVPSGVAIPVASKADLKGANGEMLIKERAVYFRSLNANGKPSSSEAHPRDWRHIAEICFNNREADFGAFVRRQLAGVTPETIKGLLSSYLQLETVPPGPKPCDLAKELLVDGEQQFERAIAERQKENPTDLSFLGLGAWSAALTICGDVPTRAADQSFMNLIGASNPRHSGWPPWLDSRSFRNPQHHPHTREGAWEALIMTFGEGVFDRADFMRMDPTGRFYLRRSFEDDLLKKDRGIEPFTVFDPVLATIRVAEVIAVGLAFARALGCTPEKTTLAFAFSWTKLKGRQVRTWAAPERGIIGRHFAHDDAATSCVELSLETPSSAIAPFVSAATRDLLTKFDGFVIVDQVIEHLVRDTIERRF